MVVVIRTRGRTRRCPSCKAKNERRATRCIVCGSPISKHGNVKVKIDGFTFDSGREGDRYLELRMKEREGWIVDLEIHPKFVLVINDVKICTYIADFAYKIPVKVCVSDKTYLFNEKGTFEVVVEDTKGMVTDVFRLKKKLMKAINKIDVVEVR